MASFNLLKFAQAVGAESAKKTLLNPSALLATSGRRTHASSHQNASVCDQVTQKTEEAAGKVSEKAQDAAEKAKQMAEDAWVSTKDAAQRAKETLENRAEVSKEYVKDHAEQVKKSMNTKGN